VLLSFVLLFWIQFGTSTSSELSLFSLFSLFSLLSLFSSLCSLVLLYLQIFTNHVCYADCSVFYHSNKDGGTSSYEMEMDGKSSNEMNNEESSLFIDNECNRE